MRGALIGPPAKTFSRARSAKGPLAAPTEPPGKFTVLLLAEQLPSGAGQHHHTLVVIIRDATKADAGRSGKFPCRTSLQPGWLTIRERGKTPLSSDRPHAACSASGPPRLSAYARRCTTTRGSPNGNYCGSTKLAADGEFEKQGAGFIGSRSRLDHCAAGRCLRGCGALCPLFLGICARVSGESQSWPPRPIHRIQYANAAIEPARRCARSAAEARQASPRATGCADRNFQLMRRWSLA